MVRNGRDHKALATVYWRVGKMRFNGDKGQLFGLKLLGLKESPTNFTNRTR